VIDPPAPVWSADGWKLAYVGRDGNTRVVPVRGEGLRTVRTSPLLFSGSTTFRVALSPRGTRVAVTGPDRGTLIGEVATGRTWRFAPGGLDVDGGVSWSPDGRELVFSRGDRRGNRQLRLARPNGSGSIGLTNDVPRDSFAHFSNAEPVWSPGGTRVAFLSNRDGWNDWELFVVGADGRGERRLTRRVSVSPPLVWSPDSRQIAFRGWGYGGSLGVVDADGSHLRRLARIPPDGDGSEVPFGFGWTGSPQAPTAPPPRVISPHARRSPPSATTSPPAENISPRPGPWRRSGLTAPPSSSPTSPPTDGCWRSFAAGRRDCRRVSLSQQFVRAFRERGCDLGGHGVDRAADLHRKVDRDERAAA
jgi:WD40-like Beta Propeller Repeat